jgi:hypothetical protein
MGYGSWTMSGDMKLIRGERLVALRLWERGYLNDQDLLRALEDISRREWPPGKKDPIRRNPDRQVEEQRDRCADRTVRRRILFRRSSPGQP